MGVFLASFSLRMGQFFDPVATRPRTNEAEVPPPRDDGWESNVLPGTDNTPFRK